MKGMKNLLWMGIGLGAGYLATKYNKKIVKNIEKLKPQSTKKSS